MIRNRKSRVLKSAVAVVTFTGCFWSVHGCDQSADGKTGSAESGASTAPPSASGRVALPPTGKGAFTEVTGPLGFEPEPKQYPDGTWMAPEITPGGLAVFDVENDGLLDVLIIRHPEPARPWDKELNAPMPNRLYRQQPDGSFKEVPGAGGLAGETGFHHGVAIGDVNEDGFQDVYVCNYGGPDQFYLNNGNGTFTEATAKAAFDKPNNPLVVSQDNWSSTAAFFDYDADGDLDLWVVHFATFDPGKRCKSADDAEELDYCGPHMFPGQLATLWRNKGGGVFEDVTEQAKIDTPARGWGVIAADLTGDGLADVLQANDEEPNQLWVNQGDGTFYDEAVQRGCAVNRFGSVEANMGVTVGDARRQGTFDIYITHISSETDTFWGTPTGEEAGNFVDMTHEAGIGPIERPFTGWGCGFIDYDNNGFLDLAVANGRVAKGPVRPEANLGTFWNRFAEPCLLFKGDGTGRYTDVHDSSGDFSKKLEVHRALAFADLHNRGAVDMLTVKLDNHLRVFRNDAAPASGNHWLQVLPMVGKRDAIGANVVLTAGGYTTASLCLRSYSYLASNDPRVHFGLGKTVKVDSLEIHWPSGAPRKEGFDVSGVDRVLVVKQGTGKAL